jgi:hypothetical protein
MQMAARADATHHLFLPVRDHCGSPCFDFEPVVRRLEDNFRLLASESGVGE